MIGYHLRLALRSFRRAPGLTALMVSAIALGIAACIVTLTVYHGMSSNPIWWKNGELYAVTMNPLSPSQTRKAGEPAYGASQLAYDDATYLFGSGIAQRETLLTFVLGAISGAPDQTRPLPTMTRATTAGFFRMFDVPFRYGGPWSAAADRGPEPVMVLSDRENQKLFGGSDSVGRTLLWSGHRFRIVGVLAPWHPLPRFYDLSPGNGGAFARPAGAFIPFQWGPVLHDWPAGHMSCASQGSASQGSAASTYQELLGSSCTWIGLWIELPTRAARRHFLAFLQAYAAAQRRALSCRERPPLEGQSVADTAPHRQPSKRAAGESRLCTARGLPDQHPGHSAREVPAGRAGATSRRCFSPRTPSSCPPARFSAVCSRLPSDSG